MCIALLQKDSELKPVPPKCLGEHNPSHINWNVTDVLMSGGQR